MEIKRDLIVDGTKRQGIPTSFCKERSRTSCFTTVVSTDTEIHVHRHAQTHLVMLQSYGGSLQKISLQHCTFLALVLGLHDIFGISHCLVPFFTCSYSVLFPIL